MKGAKSSSCFAVPLKGMKVFVMIALATLSLSFSAKASAGQFEIDESKVKEFSLEELLAKIKKYPSNSGYKDNLEMINLTYRSRIKIGFNRSNQTLPVWKVKGVEINTGQIEGLMEEYCFSKNKSAASLFFFQNIILLKYHFIADDVAKQLEITNQLNNFPKSDYWSKMDEIQSITKKEAHLVCTPIRADIESK